MSNITIVTAFFDIGRGDLPAMKHGRILPHYLHRSTELYFEYFKMLSKIKNPMVIYTTHDLVDRIRNIRILNGLGDITEVIGLDSYLPLHLTNYKEEIEGVMNSPEYIKNVVNPQMIEYWHSDYVLINALKSWYVKSAIESDLIKTNLVSWIDFGYVRNIETLPTNLEWNYPFDDNKMHMFNMRDVSEVITKRSIRDIIYTGDVYIQGCHIVGGIVPWLRMYELVITNLQTLVSVNLSDDDQTLLLMSYLSQPDMFELRYNSPDDWFRIFKDYNK